MVDWDKFKTLLEETRSLQASGQLNLATFDNIVTRAINEAGAGRFIEGLMKYAPSDWIDQRVKIPLAELA